jgi:hypothetical protein
MFWGNLDSEANASPLRAARHFASPAVECVASLTVSLLRGAAHQRVDIIELAMGRTIACGEIRAAVAITRFMKPVITTRRPALVP